MRPRARPIAVLLVLPTVLAGLAGCQEEPRDGPLSGITIDVIAIWGGAEQENFTSVYELFERQTGAKIRYTAGGDELSTLLQTRIQGGNPPNVAISPHLGVLEQLAERNELEPLAPDVVAEVERNYSPIWKELGTIDGRLYSVFFKVNDKSTFWYNHGTLEGAGLEPPETWDDFIRLCRALSDQGIPPVAVGAADGWVLTDWFENVYLQAMGPDLYDKLSRHEIPWTHESVRRTFEILTEFFGNDLLIDGGSDGALQTDFQDSVVNVFGPRADAAMVYEGDFVAGVVIANDLAVVGSTARYFRFPVINRPESIVVGGDAAVALKSDPATMAFMKFLASPESGAEWAKRGGFLSPNRHVAFETYSEDLTEELARRLVNAGGDVRFDLSDRYPAEFGATRGTGIRKFMQDYLGDPGNIDHVLRSLETAAAKALS